VGQVGTSSVDLKSLADEFLKSTNKLKRIEITKTVRMDDFHVLVDLIKIRTLELGYRGTVSVILRVEQPRVKIDNSTDCSKFVRSKVTDVLCILTCLWILFYPIKKIYEKLFKAQVQFPVLAPAATYFAVVTGQVRATR